ncbi:MAG: hypothetical protein PHN74_02200 [Candidatus Pacebacteria bacterium]|nr:hypothetical protein [Candidatus Paceibacterota bacterium]
MEVIPSINVPAIDEVKNKIEQAKKFGAQKVHIDVSDGLFTDHHLSWNNPLELKLFGLNKELEIGIHLMVNEPEDVFENWLEAGIKELIVHVEKIGNIGMIKRQCEKAGTKLILAANPETTAEGLFAYRDLVDSFLILTVKPGLSGQNFDESQLEKIKILRASFPSAKIEVDGGIYPSIAKKVKEAGADAIISGSYIWNSSDPQTAYEELKNI